jgi:pyruvate/2-oxoglutarate/acetoin dehydrogenase E1 component
VRCGFGAELAALVTEKAFVLLDAPVVRVGSLDAPMPFAPRCEEFVLPNEARIPVMTPAAMEQDAVPGSTNGKAQAAVAGRQGGSLINS